MSEGTPLELDRVTRWYGPVAGLLEVSLRLEAGVVGLLGPNGAGKSTLLNLAAGLIRPGMGRVRVFGRSPFHSGASRARVGFMPETEAFPPGVRGRGFLRTCLLLAGVPLHRVRRRTAELLDRVGLADAADRRVEGYSRGMKQRLKLAQAIGHEPDLYLLDEPLTGLDPLARRDVIELVRELGEGGACVVVSSHVLHEVESMTAQVVFIHQGQVLAEGDLHQIRTHLADEPIKVRVTAADPRRLALEVLTWNAVKGVRVGEGHLEVEALDPEAFYDRMGVLAGEEWARVTEIRPLDQDLEAVFDYLVK